MATRGGPRAELDRSVTPWGDVEVELAVGPWTVRFDGLDVSFSDALRRRWGGFVRVPTPSPPSARVLVRRAAAGLRLLDFVPGEPYRMEAAADAGPIVVRSHVFAIGAEPEGGFRLAIAPSGPETPARTIENAARWVLARLAIASGGLAFHGAGILRGGRAFVFAGPSGSGKTTVTRLTGGATSLGDDFAIAAPLGGTWAVPAVPFDNAEAAPAVPHGGPFPLKAVYRLFQAGSARVLTPAGPLAHASLLACTAFPWALPDLAPAIDSAVDAMVAAGKLRHLEFALDPSFWSAIDREP